MIAPTYPVRCNRLLLFLLLLVFSFATSYCAAQESRKLPVVRANSKTVDIQDGSHLLKAHWTISPNIERDVYYAERSDKKKRITFRTDIDSFSLDVEPGQNYDFDVLLNNKDLCHTRISTMRRGYQRVGNRSSSAPDAIPFTLGKDDKIHIQGSIGGSEPLDLLFDTGAETVVLYPSALTKKLSIKFDGTTANQGFGGVSTRQTSSDNTLQIADLRWEHEGLLYVEKQADSADGIIGYNEFQNKVVEIDYDRSRLVLHDALPKTAKQYTKVRTRILEGLPAIEVTLNIGKKKVTDWFVLDTGSNSSLHLTHPFSTTNQLFGTMTKIGTSRSGGVGAKFIENDTVLLPELTVGGSAVREIPIDQEKPSGETFIGQSFLGMRILKRFNTLIDFPNDQIYVRPNRSIDTPFRVNRNRAP